jgi:hypothetical protein
MPVIVNKIINNKGRADANMGLASCGVTCLNSSAVLLLSFSAELTVLAPKSATASSAKTQSKKPFCAF